MPSSHSAEQQALEAVLARASTDREFRQRLLAEPRWAIQQAFGLTIPAEFRIKFIERGPDADALIVLPDFRSPADELSEDELEAVSGGTSQHHAAWSNPGGLGGGGHHSAPPEPHGGGHQGAS